MVIPAAFSSVLAVRSAVGARRPPPLPGPLGGGRRLHRHGSLHRLQLQVRRAAAGLLLLRVQGHQDRGGPQATTSRREASATAGDGGEEGVAAKGPRVSPGQFGRIACVRSMNPWIHRLSLGRRRTLGSTASLLDASDLLLGSDDTWGWFGRTASVRPNWPVAQASPCTASCLWTS